MFRWVVCHISYFNLDPLLELLMHSIANLLHYIHVFIQLARIFLVTKSRETHPSPSASTPPPSATIILQFRVCRAKLKANILNVFTSTAAATGKHPPPVFVRIMVAHHTLWCESLNGARNKIWKRWRQCKAGHIIWKFGPDNFANGHSVASVVIRKDSASPHLTYPTG